MNYIELINQFWSCHKENGFSPSEIALYFHLLDTANSLGWKNPFREGNLFICAALGISEPTLQRSRDRLVKAGLIEFKSGKVKRELTEYRLLDLGINNLYQSDTLSSTLNEAPKKEIPLDNTKQNQIKPDTNSLPSTAENEIPFPESEVKKKVVQKKESEISVPLPFNGVFKEAWESWVKYRKEIKKPLKSEIGISKQLKFLASHTESEAIEIINQSIRNQWQGLFELKSKTYQTKANQFKNSEVTVYDDEL